MLNGEAFRGTSAGVLVFTSTNAWKSTLMPGTPDASSSMAETIATDPIAASRKQAGRTLLLCLGLFVLAFSWRGVHLTSLGFLHIDEVRFSLPTAQDLAAGHPLFFIRGTNYGAPIHEAVAALLFRYFGENPVTLRLPVVLFSSLAVVAGFLALRRIARESIALGLALLLACPASAVTRYGVGAHPVYAFFTLLILLLQIGAWNVDQRRSAKAWIAWALLAGFSLYVLKLAAIPIAICLFWLGLRSPAFRSWRREIVRDEQLRRAWWRIGILCSVAIVLGAPVLYRALTRRATYVPRTYEFGLIGAAGLLLSIAFVFLLWEGRLRWRNLWPVGAVTLAIALFTVPPAIHFQRVEAPRLAAAGIPQWPEKQYSFKHAHEWPFQIRLVLDRVLPAIVLGRSNLLEGEPPKTVPYTWKAAFSVMLLGFLSLGAMAGLRHAGAVRLFYSRPFVLIAPPLLIAVIMFPSWTLHSDTCFRYAVPFMTGVWLLIWRCAEPLIGNRPRVLVCLLVFYIAYCGFDCWKNLS